jgi:hypothetical protein
MSSPPSPTLLVLVVDRLPPSSSNATLNALKVFLDAHLILRPSNRCALIGARSGRAAFVGRAAPKAGGGASPPGIANPSFSFAEGETLERLERLGWRGAPETRPTVAAGLSLAVCFGHRWQNATPNGVVQVLVLTGDGGGREGGAPFDPLARQYRHIMNAVFTASKLGVTVDCLDFSRNEAPTMQQACFITKGKYVHGRGGSGDDDVLPLLVYHFLPGKAARQHLRTKGETSISFNASCFETGGEHERWVPVFVSVLVRSTKRASCAAPRSRWESGRQGGKRGKDANCTTHNTTHFSILY